MGLSEKQMAHPRSMEFSGIANSALETAFLLAKLDYTSLEKRETFAANAGRVVDSITALMLRVEKEG